MTGPSTGPTCLVLLGWRRGESLTYFSGERSMLLGATWSMMDKAANHLSFSVIAFGLWVDR